MVILKEKTAALTGVEIGDEAVGKLLRYGRWLAEEAIVAGALGPAEEGRIFDRHIIGSLCFARGWEQPPAVCWDLGSGVGLPGIPLALLWPETRMILIDRSAERIRLARRAGRIVDVGFDVVERDLSELAGTVEAIVSRAAIPAPKLRLHLERLLVPGGRAVVSGAGDGSSLPPPGMEILLVPPGILDHDPRLLIMHRQ
jgi:16S rRNA (guanine527-N7)-methyltransferase